MNGEDVLRRMQAALHKTLPSGAEIYSKAIARQLGNHAGDHAWVKSHFSELVEDTQVVAYELYQEAERTAGSAAVGNALLDQLPERPTPQQFARLIEENFWALDRFFLGLTQGRRARAGKAFEAIIQSLFDILRYPYTRQPLINGQPDFLLPRIEYFRENAMDCIIFTVKRVLRERWRQIVTEGVRGHIFYLATIDPNIAARDLEEIQRNRIYLVMPEKTRRASYPNRANIISFETFFRDHLDPAMERWRRNGVIV